MTPPVRTPLLLHVTTVHGPLDGRIFYKEARSLSALGYHVELATTVAAPEEHDGVTLLPLGTAQGSRWGRLRRDARAMRLMLSRSRDDIIHLHDPELLVAALLPLLAGKTFVYDVHEFYVERIAESEWIPAPLRGALSRCYELVERLVVPRFAGVVIVSEKMRERYAALVGDSRVALVRNFPCIAAQEADDARSAPHPLDGEPYVLHTGGASKLRAFHVMVEAAELLRERGCTWPIVNVGRVDLSDYDESTREDLMRRAARADVRNAGVLQQHDTWRYVAHAAIGYLPLIPVENNRRGMPNKLFEYLYFGLPIVATDIGRVAEIVTQTEAGLLAPPEDGAAHGNAILRLATDAALREHLSLAALRASPRFTFDGELDRLVRLYRMIDAGRGYGRPPALPV